MSISFCPRAWVSSFVSPKASAKDLKRGSSDFMPSGSWSLVASKGTASGVAAGLPSSVLPGSTGGVAPVSTVPAGGLGAATGSGETGATTGATGATTGSAIFILFHHLEIEFGTAGVQFGKELLTDIHLATVEGHHEWIGAEGVDERATFL